MSAIGLRLRIRRDGTLCITDADGRVGPVLNSDGSVLRDGRAFPEEHFFTYEFIGRNGASVKLGENSLELTLANAHAVYEMTDRADNGVHAKLTSSELSDAPPIDEDAAAAIQEARAAVNEAAGEVAGQAAGASEARPGRAVVTEDEG